MVIGTAIAVALFCPRCGKIKMHQVSRFCLKGDERKEFLCECGQVQAAITSAPHRQYVFNIPCIMCQTNHLIFLDSKRFWATSLDKLYCSKEKLELGFYGQLAKVQQTIADNEEAFLTSFGEADYESADTDDNLQIILEILNKVHDLAEQGGVYCRCGSKSVVASLLNDGVLLECKKCGGQRVVRARDDQDLLNNSIINFIEIEPWMTSNRKH